MPKKLHLTWGTGEYESMLPLIDGIIEPEGIELNPLLQSSPERHWRMLRHEEYDLCELSLSSFLMMFDQGRDFIAIPAFPHRRFRHSFIFVNPDYVKKPKDLIGKKVGLMTYQATAALWIRGILEDEYGVPVDSIEWFTLNDEPVPFKKPITNISIEKLPEGSNLDLMLQKGELHGVIYPNLLPSMKKSGHPKVKRLFENYKEEEIAYYQKTGIFPIMHTVVFRSEIVKKYPWVPASILKALRESLQLCYKKMENPRRYNLCFHMRLLEEQKKLFGQDPWKFNFNDNEFVLKKAIEYSYKQGLISKNIDPEDLFVPSTLDEKAGYIE
ncbi:MAG TPA: ABC transporter substrate-binding protein [Atribacterota bacterium]|nr:ABC transporter substrate-binding protein [Atribacterota bacterium]